MRKMKLQEITEKFNNEINQDKISASYLFYGDKRVDLFSYALMFSKMIMTKDVQNDSEKEKIERLINNFQHPDIEIINKSNENIKIDEVREIIYSSIESSFNSPKNIYPVRNRKLAKRIFKRSFKNFGRTPTKCILHTSIKNIKHHFHNKIPHNQISSIWNEQR